MSLHLHTATRAFLSLLFSYLPLAERPLARLRVFRKDQKVVEAWLSACQACDVCDLNYNQSSHVTQQVQIAQADFFSCLV